MRVVSIIGARPQFIKAAPLSKALKRAGHQEFLLHTGQHYDRQMSYVFFEELGLRAPDVNLEIGSGYQGAQTGAMLAGIEDVLLREKAERVLVYGDTNSTLAGGLAAAKLRIAVTHVEAGLRSFNRAMPEEINRIMVDHLSDLLLCPSETAVNNLAAEGIRSGVHLVGDLMHDAVLQFAEVAENSSDILRELEIEAGQYLLATVHRAENTDDASRLRSILEAFALSGETIIFPIHPRSKKVLASIVYNADSESAPDSKWTSCVGSTPSSSALGNVHCIDPVGYLDMLMLERNARLILTDSGGMQKEACWLGVPSITLREETEWVETVEAGCNVLVGADTSRILAAISTPPIWLPAHANIYGQGEVAERCLHIIESHG